MKKNILEEDYLFAPKTRDINITNYDYSVEFLVNKIRDGKIILDVDFQRRLVWDNNRASSLIESILMNVPIPPIYFAETEDGKWLVLDGLQRLSSIKRFYDDDLKLTKLGVYSELDTKTYSQLMNTPIASKLDNGLLRVNLIRNDSDPDIKYDVFMRLNQGAMTLNYQELRNCLYRGNLNEALKELVLENKELFAIFPKPSPDKRFVSEEFILRFFAIADNIIKDKENKYCVSDYKGSLVQYLNAYMQKNKDIDLGAKAEYKQRFNEVMKKTLIVFEAKEAFRKFGDAKTMRPIADYILASFDKLTTDYLTNNKESIRNKYVELLEDNIFYESVFQKKSTSTTALNYRINRWMSEFDNDIQL